MVRLCYALLRIACLSILINGKDGIKLDSIIVTISYAVLLIMHSSSKRIVRVNKRDIKLRSIKLLLEGRVNIFHVHLSVNVHSWKLLRAKSTWNQIVLRCLCRTIFDNNWARAKHHYFVCISGTFSGIIVVDWDWSRNYRSQHDRPINVNCRASPVRGKANTGATGRVAGTRLYRWQLPSLVPEVAPCVDATVQLAF